LTPRGATFAGKPAYKDKEFIATTDPWSHLVNIDVGPDGAMYLCDMYRKIIEHPQFIPKHIIPTLDLRAGDQQGRIYRLVPKGYKPQPLPKLHQASVAELVALLDHPNVWQRETAQRLLVERQEKSAQSALETLA